jgi:2'-5' RNA ligase
MVALVQHEDFETFLGNSFTVCNPVIGYAKDTVQDDDGLIPRFPEMAIEELHGANVRFIDLSGRGPERSLTLLFTNLKTMADLNMPDFLAAVSYPQLSEHDYQFIDSYRKSNDIFYDLIPAHFSFIFPIFDLEKDSFVSEVRKQAKGFPRIDFNIRCAIRNNDRTSDYWHVLLVPDQGFSEVVNLHDRLYSGLFRQLERLDLDFVPHVAIANSIDPQECKRMVDEINEMNINISGTIDQLEIIQHRENQVSTIEMVKLAG